jgi:hypothetical protein
VGSCHRGCTVFRYLKDEERKLLRYICNDLPVYTASHFLRTNRVTTSFSSILLCWLTTRLEMRYILSWFNDQTRGMVDYWIYWTLKTADNYEYNSYKPLHQTFVRSVKLLLVFASTVIPGFGLLEIHDQNFCSLLNMNVFRNGASSSTKVGSVCLCKRYVCCTVVSARVYPRSHGVQATLCHCTVLSNIYTKPVP